MQGNIMNDPSMNGNGRDPMSGRFEPGHQFSKGNAVARRTRELRQAILDAVTPDQVKAVITKMAELAQSGDCVAARIFLDHVCGRPAQSVELTGIDGSSLELSSVVATIMSALGDNLEARVAVAAAFHRLGSGSGNGPDASSMGS